jgi:hypothetical protein
MTKCADLLEAALAETRACQDVNSPEYLDRKNSSYGPWGPLVRAKGGSGQYPTTDKAMDALARLADQVRSDDPVLKRGVGPKTARKKASEVFGEMLRELDAEPERRTRWKLFREELKRQLQSLRLDVLYYVPVWLFVGQTVGPIQVGPVRFVDRHTWLDVIAERRGSAADWMALTRAHWLLEVTPASGAWSSIVRLARRSKEALLKRLRMRPRPKKVSFEDADRAWRVARAVHPDQWVACVEVLGCEQEEAYRRAVLAARVALDSFRLFIPREPKRKIYTVADPSAPAGVSQFAQVAGRDLGHGSTMTMPGISGAPGLAQQIVANGAPILEAAGECIRQACTSQPPSPGDMPTLSERWFNAVRWFGRACLTDVDYVSIVMLVIALDILSGGLEKNGIAELLSRLTGHPLSGAVLPDGTTLEQLVSRAYGLRSEIAHGSILALHGDWDEVRAQLEDLASIAIREYVLALAAYRATGGLDDRDAFRMSLPPLQT